MSTPRLCLNMIVKNEAKILERCLSAAAPHIAYWVICDTGSTDGTQDLARRFFEGRGIPGKIVEAPFVNFEQARNAALAAARSAGADGRFDYILLCDADMELVVEDPAFRGQLREGAYKVVQRTASGLEYPNVRLVRRDAEAFYRGVTHEVLHTPGVNPRVLGGCHFLDHACGSNRAEKFERDIRLLGGFLAEHPGDARSVFYLANSYYDVQRYEEAIDRYRQRIALGGWAEEVFYSRYRIGLSLLASGRTAEAVHELLTAFDAFPHRAEPLHVLAKHFMDQRQWRLGYEMARIGAQVAKPEHGLFVESAVYSWRLRDVMAVCGYWLGRTHEAAAINRELLKIVPPSEEARIRANLGYCEGAR